MAPMQESEVSTSTEVTPISTGYVSIVLSLCHACGADTFHFSQCVNPHQVRCSAYLLHPSSGSLEPSGADTQDFYFWRMLEHNAAIQLYLAWSRQEVKRRNNTQHPVTFQTPAHESQKREKHKLFCWSFGQEHFALLFLITWTYNCGREWLCDYRGNSSASRCQLPTILCSGGLKPQPVGIAGGQQGKTGLEPQRSRPISSGNWG